jgi:hypothetical protein
MAARHTRATVNAGSRISAHLIPGAERAHPGSISPEFAGVRLCRESERRNRIPVGARPIRSIAGAIVRSGPPSGGRARHRWRRACGARGKAATATIPIVFTSGLDPIQLGLVSSLNRPGGNITGVSFLAVELGAKRVGLLRELVPQATTLALLVNPNNPNAPTNVRNARAAAEARGQKVVAVTASTEREVDAAFAIVVQQHARPLSSRPIRSLSVGATNSSGWRRAMQCRRSTNYESLRLPGVLSATAAAYRRCIA